MLRLEQITKGCTLRGVTPGAEVVVVDVEWIGEVISLTYRTLVGKVATELKFRSDEPTLELVENSTNWAFDSDGALFRLLSEARRIQLAHLFDPLLAVHSSQIEPLPHQILAVYQEMLSPTRQPLRFLLADDPGAGKTVMAGLLIRELMIRGDLRRCMVVCPGALAEQWQDELHEKFDLNFKIATTDSIEAAASGNWFQENDLAICRLDKLSRDEAVQEKLKASDWDLIICDEAHKMSATYTGGEFKTTKRYQLGRLLGGVTRHLLLMTATPHNGKNEDFQAFLALLDSDRFEGRQRNGKSAIDASDLIRRLTKEQLRRFDGTPLFPERIAALEEQTEPVIDQLFDHIRVEAQQTSEKIKQIAESLIDGLNDQMANGMMGQHMDFGHVLQSAGHGLAVASLQRMEGMLFGKGNKPPKGTTNDRIHVTTQAEEGGAKSGMGSILGGLTVGAKSSGSGGLFGSLLGWANNNDWLGSHMGSLFGKGGLFDGGSASGLLSSIGGLFHFALGGNVAAGVPVVTGELGREVFVPSTPGRIVSHKDAFGSTNNVSIDARGASDPASTYAAVHRAMRPYVAMSGPASMAAQADHRRRTPQHSKR